MTITITHQWYRHATSSPTVSPVTITGATSPSYTSTNADIGFYLHRRETATNAAGSSFYDTNVVGPIPAAGTTFTPEAGFIAPLTSAIGGRVPVPYDPPWEFEKTFFDAARASHMALHKQLCDDVKVNSPSLYTETIANGNWSNPAIWSNGVPHAGMYACLNHDVTYDVYSTAQLESVVFHKRFVMDKTADRLLNCDTVLGMAGSYWGMGTVASPVPESTTFGRGRIEFWFTPGTGAPGTSAKLGYMTAGEVEMCGAEKPEVLTCTVDPMTGATVLFVSEDVSAIQPGDEIIIETQQQNSGTVSTDSTYTGPAQYHLKGGYDEPYPEGPGYGFKLNQQNEHRQVISVDTANRKLTIDTPLQYDHPTRTPTRDFKDGRTRPSIKPQISVLSRSIRFIGKGNPAILQQRPHGMFMMCSRVDVRNVQAIDMGRTDTTPTLTSFNSNNITSDSAFQNPINDPNNVRGRYSWHFHGIGRNNNRPAGVLYKCVANKSRNTPYPCPGWMFTHHNSRAYMHNCIAYGGRGGAFITELGTEVGQWIKCRAIWMRGDGSPFGYGRRCDLIQNHNGHMGCGYDLQSRAILMQGCVAKSCQVHTVTIMNNGGYGNEPVRAPDLQAIRLLSPIMLGGTQYGEDPHWGTDKYLNNQAQPPDWNDQLAVDCNYGFFVAERHRIFRYDMTPMIAINFVCYGVNEPVFILDYSWHYYFYDIVAFGATGSRIIYMGPKSGHMHVSRGIVEGYTNIFNGDPNWYANAIDLATDATDQYMINSPVTGHVYPPTFVIDNPSPPDTGTSIHLSDLGGKRLTLDYYDVRHTADPMRGPIQFDGVWTDGAGPAPWPFLKEIDYIQYAMPSSSPPIVIVQLNGCFYTGGAWYTRLWFVNADRHPPLVSGKPTPHAVFSLDIPLTNFPADFLAANTINPNDGQPVLPILPESFNKPRDAVQIPTNVSPPFLSAVAIEGRQVSVNVGTWSEYPAEVDDYMFSWKASGAEFATTRVATIPAGTAGKTLTCDVTAINTATPGEGNGVTMSALYSSQIQSAAPDLPSIWGANFVDLWQLDKTPVHTGRVGTAPQINDNVLLDGEQYLNYWYGVNGGMLQGNGRLFWQKYGWDGKPCLYMEGLKTNPAFVSGTVNVQNPVMFVVMERDTAAVDPSYPDIAIIGHILPFFEGAMQGVTNDASQNLAFDLRNGLTSTGLPKGSRAVISMGAGPGQARLAVNNQSIQTASVTTPAAGSYTLQVGVSTGDSYPYRQAKMKVRAIALIDMKGATPTFTQFIATQTYMAQRFL